ncbi:MAG: imidazole glycerol phosphate synthase subunit HisH [Thermoplasmata archaeon]
MNSVAIVDTGTGNLFGIRRGFRQIGYRARVTRDVGTLRAATLVVIPGVASFSATCRGLTGLRSVLLDRHRRDRAILGVCAGFQAFAERSEEGPGRGLGLTAQPVRPLGTPRCPHIGWSPLTLRTDPLFEGLGTDAPWVFFAHSFALPAPRRGLLASAKHDGLRFTAAARWATAVGVQFHPELSGRIGRRFLSNMMQLAEGAE